MTSPAGALGGLKALAVAVGVLEDARGQILIAERMNDPSHAGLWEFPGGKLNEGESSRAALERELWEELGIHDLVAHPFMRIPWAYPERRVLLEVFKVSAWQGQAQGREGQAVQWVAREQLMHWTFPAANRGIVQALRLPDRYWLTPEPEHPTTFLQQLEGALQNGMQLLQYRAKGLEREAWLALGRRTLGLAAAAQVIVLANASPEDAARLGAPGLHLTSERLMRLQRRPADFDWCAASCHSLQEITKAADLALDFIVLGPVLPTPSHPGARGIGWQQAAEWVALSPLPVFLIGGLASPDLPTATALGAQGIAAIRAWWPSGV